MLARAPGGGRPAGLRITSVAGSQRLPLAPGSHRISGPLGISVVEVDQELGVRVQASPCPLGLCRRQGRIRSRGQALACVPNRILVELSGTAGPGALDGVTG